MHHIFLATIWAPSVCLKALWYSGHKGLVTAFHILPYAWYACSGCSLKDLSNEELAQLFDQAFLSTGLSARNLLPQRNSQQQQQPDSPSSNSPNSYHSGSAFGRLSAPSLTTVPHSRVLKLGQSAPPATSAPSPPPSSELGETDANTRRGPSLFPSASEAPAVSSTRGSTMDNQDQAQPSPSQQGGGKSDPKGSSAGSSSFANSDMPSVSGASSSATAGSSSNSSGSSAANPPEASPSSLSAAPSSKYGSSSTIQYDDEDESYDATRDLFGSLIGGSLPGGSTTASTINRSTTQQAEDSAAQEAAASNSLLKAPSSLMGRLLQGIQGGQGNDNSASTEGTEAETAAPPAASFFPSLPSLPQLPAFPSPPFLPSLPSFSLPGFPQQDTAPSSSSFEPAVMKAPGEEVPSDGLHVVLDVVASAASAVSGLGAAVGQMGAVMGGVDRGNVALFAGGAVAATAAAALLLSKGGAEEEEGAEGDQASGDAAAASSATASAASDTTSTATSAAGEVEKQSSPDNAAAAGRASGVAAAAAAAGADTAQSGPSVTPSRLRRLLDNGPDMGPANIPPVVPSPFQPSPSLTTQYDQVPGAMIDPSSQQAGSNVSGAAAGGVLWQRSEAPAPSAPPAQSRVLWERPTDPPAPPMPPPPVLPSYEFQQQQQWQQPPPPTPPTPPSGSGASQGPQGFMSRFFASRPWGGSTATATPVMDPVRTAARTAAAPPELAGSDQAFWVQDRSSGVGSNSVYGTQPRAGSMAVARGSSSEAALVPPDPWTGSTAAPGTANAGEAARVARAVGLPVSALVLPQPKLLDISSSPWDEPVRPN